MLTPTPKDKNQLVNTMAVTRQYEQSKRFASPIYDICCQKGMYSSSTGISKLCFVRCYSSDGYVDGLKMNLKDVENYGYLMPQEVEII